MSNRTYEYLMEVKDHATNPMQRIANEMGATDRKAESLKKEMHGLGGEMKNTSLKSEGLITSLNSFKSAAIAGGILTISAAVVKVGREMSDAGAVAESNMVSFETMLKSATKAERLTNQLNQFANFTPFKNDEVNKAGKNLLAFGVSADNIIPTLRRVGDVASGLNIPFNELSEIYGKIKVQQTVYSEDLNQLAGRGIPIFTELATVMGTGSENIKKLASQGKIGFKEIEQAFTNMTKEGGTFFNMMEKQSGTFGGKLSTAQGKFGLLMQQQGLILNKSLTPFLDLATNGLDLLLDKEERQSDFLRKQMVLSTAYFNTLEKGNVSQKNRSDLITKINDRYGEYLPNLLTEKSSLEDVAAAHDKITQSLKNQLTEELKMEAQRDLLMEQASLTKSAARIEMQKMGIEELKGISNPDERSAIAEQFMLTGSTVSEVNRAAKNLKLAENSINSKLELVNKKIAASDKAFEDVFGDKVLKQNTENKPLVEKKENSTTDSGLNTKLDSIASGGSKSITINYGGVKVADEIILQPLKIEEGMTDIEQQFIQLMNRMLQGSLHTVR